MDFRVSGSQQFVGRHDERVALSEAFACAAAGSTTIVALSGDVGIGKSRLVNEFIASHGENAAGSGQGRCIEHLHIPFLPFADIFRGLGLDASDMETQPAANLSPRRRLEWQQQRFRDLSLSLASARAPRPYIVVIEDLQWADAATLGLLEHLAVSRTSGPLLIVVTIRAESLERPGKFARTLSRLRMAGLTTIRLQPLERIQMIQFIRAAARRSLPRSAIERLEQLAEGNPLIAEELLRAYLDKGQETPSHPAFQSVRSSVIERLYTLGEEDQRVLITAAALGAQFDARLLPRLINRSLSDILAALRRARNMQLVREFGQGGSTVGFRHAAYRDIIYGELLTIEGQELHRCIAKMLEGLPDRHDHVVSLAYHWSSAGDRTRALPYHVQAADTAMTFAAFEDAARDYEIALRSLETSSPAYAELAEKRAYAWYSAGVSESTSECFAEALKAYEFLGNTKKVIEMLLFLSRQAWNDADSAAGLVHALEAAELLGSENGNYRDYALTMAASYAVQLGDSEKANRLLGDINVTVSDDILARRLDTSATAAWLTGNAEVALDAAQHAREVAERNGDPDLLVRVYSNSADLLTVLGRNAEALDRWRMAFNAAQAGGFIGRMAYAALGYASALLESGELERARHLYTLAVGTGTMNASVAMLCGSVGALLRALLGSAVPLVISENETLALALGSREPLRIGQIVGTLGIAALFENRINDARCMFDKAMDALTSTSFAEPLLLLAGLFGNAESQLRARSELELIASKQHAGLARTFYDGILADKRRPLMRRDAFRSVATECSRHNRRLHELLFLRQAGDFAEAAIVLKSIGATAVCNGLRSDSGNASPIKILTRREREVAVLLTDEHTNRAIAEQLNISERTVEHHVESILSQIGVRSRWLVTAELLGPYIR